jgi:hypothetical protein
MSEWHGSDPAYARSEFVAGLSVLGIEVDSNSPKARLSGTT